EIADMTRHIVARAKSHNSDTVPGDFVTLQVPCPKCGGVIKENYKKFQCQNCDFALWKIAASRQFEVSEIEELISKGVVGPLQGFRSKMGKPFAAYLVIDEENKVKFEIEPRPPRTAKSKAGREAKAQAPIEKIDFTGQESLGKCPKCGGRVFEGAKDYICENSQSSNRP